MSWQTDIYDTGSFRGITFFVDRHDLSGLGRRLVHHEYPGREAYSEDLGPKKLQYSFPAYVVGDNYLTQRNELIKALNLAGAGELVHPWFGRLQVKVDDGSVTESTENGGMATFNLVFVPANDNTAPARSIVTQDAVNNAASSCVDAISGDIEKTLVTAGQPSWSIESLVDRLNDLSTLLGSKTNTLAAKLGKPAALAAAVNDAVRRLMATSRLALETLLSVDNAWPKISLDTAARRQQARNQHAIATLVKTTAVAAYASQLADTTLASQQESHAALARISDAIDIIQATANPLSEPVADTVWLAMQDLRATVAADIQARGLQLPAITYYTPLATVPALLLAHQLYGDALRADDIVQRNHIRQPGFVAGGIALEILREQVNNNG